MHVVYVHVVSGKVVIIQRCDAPYRTQISAHYRQTCNTHRSGSLSDLLVFIQ